jgi:hypothetical protein
MPDESRARPLSVVEHSSVGDLDQVRSAIATGDRRGALKLLRAHVEGELDLSTVPTPVADALVETARGVDHAKPDSARFSLAGVEEARGQVIQLLATTPFSSADLAEIRHVLESLEEQARQAEERARCDNLRRSGLTEPEGRRMGSVWLELKYIPDNKSGRVYGPYVYGRWRDSGHKRSRYIGKA